MSLVQVEFVNWLINFAFVSWHLSLLKGKNVNAKIVLLNSNKMSTLYTECFHIKFKIESSSRLLACDVRIIKKNPWALNCHPWIPLKALFNEFTESRMMTTKFLLRCSLRRDLEVELRFWDVVYPFDDKILLKQLSSNCWSDKFVKKSIDVVLSKLIFSKSWFNAMHIKLFELSSDILWISVTQKNVFKQKSSENNFKSSIRPESLFDTNLKKTLLDWLYAA